MSISLLVFFLEWSLRVFGAFWVIGAAITFQKARQASFIDTALEVITQKK